MQVSSFFKTRHNDIHQQHRYAAVSKLFVKFSTTLASSAPVERLLSAAGHVLPRRNRPHDDMFEILLFLNKNAHSVA